MAGTVHQRIVALAVGDKRAEDTRYMWRFAYAHILEQHDRVVVVHARIGAPAGWVPLNVGQAVGADEAGWLPEEMRAGLKAFKHAEYWQLKGLTAADAVEEFVETRGVRPDLLVVGSRGEGGLKRALMGSTSSHIVQTVDVPTLVIRVPIFVNEAPPFRLPTTSGAELAAPLPRPDRRRQIAIALDGSPVSGVLVRWATQTLLRGSDSVALLHAPAGQDEFATLSAAGQLVECEAVLERFFQSAEKAKEQVRTLRLAPDEDPREALVKAVEREGPYDLLVVGSRGLGALKRAAAKVTGHGSVSTHCLEHAGCPVLVVSRATLLSWIEAAAVPPPAAAPTTPGKPEAARGTEAERERERERERVVKAEEEEKKSGSPAQLTATTTATPAI